MLDISKTKWMGISRKDKIRTNKNIQINDNNIERVKSMKYLL